MQLISVCACITMLILLYGTSRQYYVEIDGGEYRLQAPKSITRAFLAVLVITSTLRYGFIDTHAYKEMYILARNNYDYIFTGAGWGIETGWLWLMYVLNYISRSPKLMLFLSALLVCGAYVKVIRRYSEQVLFSLLLFFCLIYMDTNNGIRQMCASAILILGFPALEKKKYLTYAICALAAYQLHNSAIVIALIALTAIGKPLNVKTLGALLLGGVFFFMPGPITGFLDTALENNQYNYYLAMRGGMGIVRALVTGIVPVGLSLSYVYKVKHRSIAVSYAEGMLINITVINGMFVMMGTYMQFWNRFAFYTFFAPIVMIPKMARVVFGNENYFRAMKRIMIVLYLAYFAFNVFMNSGLPGASSDALQQFYIEWWC